MELPQFHNTSTEVILESGLTAPCKYYQTGDNQMWIAIFVALLNANTPPQAVALPQTFASKQEFDREVQTNLAGLKEHLKQQRTEVEFLDWFCVDISH